MDKDVVPYLALLLAVGLIYVPRLFVAYGQAKRPEGYDNSQPRAQQAKLTGMAARAQAAHNNSFEAFAPFAAGVLACQVSGVDSDEVVLWSMGFVALRTVYLVAYLRDVHILRTAVWVLGFLVSLVLLSLPMFT